MCRSRLAFLRACPRRPPDGRASEERAVCTRDRRLSCRLERRAPLARRTDHGPNSLVGRCQYRGPCRRRCASRGGQHSLRQGCERLARERRRVEPLPGDARRHGGQPLRVVLRSRRWHHRRHPAGAGGTAKDLPHDPVWCPPRFRTPQAASLARYSFGVRYPSAECGRSVS